VLIDTVRDPGVDWKRIAAELGVGSALVATFSGYATYFRRNTQAKFAAERTTPNITLRLAARRSITIERLIPETLVVRKLEIMQTSDAKATKEKASESGRLVERTLRQSNKGKIREP
jgi:hypothetical protein